MSTHLPPDTVLFDFSARDLDALVDACAQDELLPVIEAIIPRAATVLEAGAGSGRWIKALTDRGYATTGIELNRADVDRFRVAWPDLPYDYGSVEHLPYADGQFDALLSLGVIEHLFHGPERAMAEMRRVLKPSGVMLLTVPAANASFRLERMKDALAQRLYGSNAVRQALRKPPLAFSTDQERSRLEAIRRDRRAGMAVKYRFARDSGRDFYEYRFTAAQLRTLVVETGFTVDTMQFLYGADRLYQIFGRLLGQYDGLRSPRLNRIGRGLAAILPAEWIGHMLLIVARRC